MRIYFLLLAKMLLACLFLACGNSNNNAEYEGYTIPNRPDSTLVIRGTTTAVRAGEQIYLFKMDATGDLELVAAQYPSGRDNRFEFTVTVTEPTFYALNFYNRQQEGFWLYKSDVNITAEAVNQESYFQISGCRDNDLLRKFKALSDDIAAQMQQMKAEEHIEYRREKVETFLEDAGTSIVSIMASNLLIPEEDLDKMEDIGQKLTKVYPRSSYVKNYIKNLELAKSLMVGQPAPDIKFKTQDGRTTSLSALKGKFVYLDFWSSSMPQALQSMQQLQGLYATYQPKGVEFVSIYMDKDADEPFKLNTTGCKWPQVIDRADSLSNCMESYAVKPQNGYFFGYFINPEGKILAKGGLRGAKITSMLENAVSN
ncbi:MAG: AhpC/TSA family protein [Cytophagales bacterium]|nr:MAG: AhpC/TSA family protein [Cytophagales bacterium]TAF62159.1 MAG: AhpC/TSA family protein [Cytophagales bacterium]